MPHAQKARGKLQLEYYCSDQPDEILLQGELMKLGGGHGGTKNWKNRFFVLTEDNLAYYESEKSFKKGDRPKGVVLLNAYFCCKTATSSLSERSRALWRSATRMCFESCRCTK